MELRGLPPPPGPRPRGVGRMRGVQGTVSLRSVNPFQEFPRLFSPERPWSVAVRAISMGFHCLTLGLCASDFMVRRGRGREAGVHSGNGAGRGGSDDRFSILVAPVRRMMGCTPAPKSCRPDTHDRAFTRGCPRPPHTHTQNSENPHPPLPPCGRPHTKKALFESLCSLEVNVVQKKALCKDRC